MVLYTIIGEYDVLYAQERELAGYRTERAQAVMSTRPEDFLRETALPVTNNYNKGKYYYEYN